MLDRLVDLGCVIARRAGQWRMQADTGHVEAGTPRCVDQSGPTAVSMHGRFELHEDATVPSGERLDVGVVANGEDRGRRPWRNERRRENDGVEFVGQAVEFVDRSDGNGVAELCRKSCEGETAEAVAVALDHGDQAVDGVRQLRDVRPPWCGANGEGHGHRPDATAAPSPRPRRPMNETHQIGGFRSSPRPDRPNSDIVDQDYQRYGRPDEFAVAAALP